MSIVRMQSIFRFLGWSSAVGSVAWGVLFYLRFNNPVVDAFHDIPAQVSALEAAALAWKTVGFSLIGFSAVSLVLGYLGRTGIRKQYPATQKEQEHKVKNIAEGT